ncbi:unnamed protein product, partial [Tetraodon nigroviridis]
DILSRIHTIPTVPIVDCFRRSDSKSSVTFSLQESWARMNACR